MPAARYGIREEMKQRYGFGWREYVRGITTTFDAVTNLAFGEKARQRLAEIDAKHADKIDAGYTLDPAKIADDRHSPGVIVAAANAQGEIVRYFEQGENAAYFGSPFARETATGYYDAGRESRMVASTGKIIAAIAIANTLRDTPQSLYLDTQAPAQGLETCAKGGERHGRRALVAFACSLNDPLMHRTAQVGQARVQEAHRRSRLQHAAGQRRRQRHAAVDGRRPRPGCSSRRGACITSPVSCWRASSAAGQRRCRRRR